MWDDIPHKEGLAGHSDAELSRRTECTLSAVRKKLVKGQPDVPRDFAKQVWRRDTAVLVAELLVRASPSGFLETKRGENGDDLARF